MSDLAVARGGVPVLEKVQFALHPGEALILRGPNGSGKTTLLRTLARPNGSGKTTLLRTLARLQLPLAGEISGDPDDIAYAGHADGIKATLSVGENLTFWAQVFGGHDITAALQSFDLEPLVNRPAGALSAGQKRRLGLARMAVTGRALWLFDEPTVSLDAQSVRDFAAMVQRHLSGGGAAILATHIDLGIEAQTLDLTPFKAALPSVPDFDEAFL